MLMYAIHVCMLIQSGEKKYNHCGFIGLAQPPSDWTESYLRAYLTYSSEMTCPVELGRNCCPLTFVYPSPLEAKISDKRVCGPSPSVLFMWRKCGSFVLFQDLVIFSSVPLRSRSEPLLLLRMENRKKYFRAGDSTQLPLPWKWPLANHTLSVISRGIHKKSHKAYNKTVSLTCLKFDLLLGNWESMWNSLECFWVSKQQAILRPIHPLCNIEIVLAISLVNPI